MKTTEIKEILIANRPSCPRKTKDRRFQRALDEAIEILDKYENLQKIICAVPVEINSLESKNEHDKRMAYEAGLEDGKRARLEGTRIVDEDGNIKCSECGSAECWNNYCAQCGAKITSRTKEG